MKNIRLTEHIRLEILRLVIDHGFEEEGKNLDKEEFSIGKEIYEKTFSKEHREIMAGLPVDWLPSHNSIYIRTPIGGLTFRLGEGFRFPTRFESIAVSGLNDQKLYEKAVTFKDKREEYRKRWREAERDAKAVLFSEKTNVGLVNTWPSISKFVEEVTKKTHNSRI